MTSCQEALVFTMMRQSPRSLARFTRGDDHPPDAPSTRVLACRDTYQLADPLATVDERPSADNFLPHAANHEDMACSDVVVQNIIEVRVECFVDGAEVLAKPFEDEPACLLLVACLKGSDVEFTFHECLLLNLPFMSMDRHQQLTSSRSEERRVGKECRSR